MKRAERWIEWGKDLLIVLLALSAALLLSVLLLGSGRLSGLVPRQEPTTGTGGEDAPIAATMPAALVVTNGEGRYGVQYDQARTDELFTRTGPLLGDALASAGEPLTILRGEWQENLSAPGLYFDFGGSVPLSALGGWLSEAGECTLGGSARRLLLCAGEGDQVLLCWQDADTDLFYRSSTALSRSLHLEPILGDTRANGAYFAYEDESLSALLQPYTLVTEEERTRTEYDVTNPLTQANASDLLSALSFSDQNHTQVSGGEAYLDGGDRLEVEEAGGVTYRAARGGKYPAGPGAAGAIEASRALAEKTVGALCGEAALYLISARQTEDGFEVSFGYRLNGSAVRLYQEGWCARFLVREGFITDFTLLIRRYTANGQTAMLLPIDRAAAVLPELTEERLELLILYLDGGGDTAAPQWVAE